MRIIVLQKQGSDISLSYILLNRHTLLIEEYLQKVCNTKTNIDTYKVSNNKNDPNNLH